MNKSFSIIETTLQNNIDDVYRLLEFDKVILDLSISTVEELQEKLVRHHNLDNPALTAGKTLIILKNIRDNESLKRGCPKLS